MLPGEEPSLDGDPATTTECGNVHTSVHVSWNGTPFCNGTGIRK